MASIDERFEECFWALGEGAYTLPELFEKLEKDRKLTYRVVQPIRPLYVDQPKGIAYRPLLKLDLAIAELENGYSQLSVTLNDELDTSLGMAFASDEGTRLVKTHIAVFPEELRRKGLGSLMDAVRNEYGLLRGIPSDQICVRYVLGTEHARGFSDSGPERIAAAVMKTTPYLR